MPTPAASASLPRLLSAKVRHTWLTLMITPCSSSTAIESHCESISECMRPPAESVLATAASARSLSGCAGSRSRLPVDLGAGRAKGHRRPSCCRPRG
ncbi:MAG: hypothetical protein CAPSK01_001690 [Candidatus Accumulibacter vicinus]|uniref:Uncharacterized protein n=1 Tax=Candidatus Accumulibacter vicinus TaxID=2954382 RepID=A0A084Y291_9PROT|nr:MAG: hypothetical protein CAPSK01_001690 [Candidatus Accumulibacter vicinus]